MAKEMHVFNHPFYSLPFSFSIALKFVYNFHALSKCSCVSSVQSFFKMGKQMIYFRWTIRFHFLSQILTKNAYDWYLINEEMYVWIKTILHVTQGHDLTIVNCRVKFFDFDSEEKIFLTLKNFENLFLVRWFFRNYKNKMTKKVLTKFVKRSINYYVYRRILTP